MREIHYSDFDGNIESKSSPETCNKINEKHYFDNVRDEINGMKFYIDDNGDLYRVNNHLIANMEYTINGIDYKTSTDGEIESFEGSVKYTPDNERDNKAQREVGNGDKLEDDDGGHLIARMLNGSSDIDNMVPMRSTINRGDYSISENEIKKELLDGRLVYVRGEIIREDKSTTRPTKIELNYNVGEFTKILIVDNVDGSIDLLDDIRLEATETYGLLKNEIEDMNEDGISVSVTSVLKEYNEDGSLNSIIVRYRDEVNKEKYSMIYYVD